MTSSKIQFYFNHNHLVQIAFWNEKRVFKCALDLETLSEPLSFCSPFSADRSCWGSWHQRPQLLQIPFNTAGTLQVHSIIKPQHLHNPLLNDKIRRNCESRVGGGGCQKGGVPFWFTFFKKCWVKHLQKMFWRLRTVFLECWYNLHDTLNAPENVTNMNTYYRHRQCCIRKAHKCVCDKLNFPSQNISNFSSFDESKGKIHLFFLNRDVL